MSPPISRNNFLFTSSSQPTPEGITTSTTLVVLGSLAALAGIATLLAQFHQLPHFLSSLNVLGHATLCGSSVLTAVGGALFVSGIILAVVLGTSSCSKAKPKESRPQPEQNKKVELPSDPPIQEPVLQPTITISTEFKEEVDFFEKYKKALSLYSYCIYPLNATHSALITQNKVIVSPSSEIQTPEDYLKISLNVFYTKCTCFLISFLAPGECFYFSRTQEYYGRNFDLRRNNEPEIWSWGVNKQKILEKGYFIIDIQVLETQPPYLKHTELRPLKRFIQPGQFAIFKTDSNTAKILYHDREQPILLLTYQTEREKLKTIYTEVFKDELLKSAQTQKK